MNKSDRKRYAAILPSCIALCVANVAWAQDGSTGAATAPDDDDRAQERMAGAPAPTREIVVTALKRETGLQDTPLAISAVSSEVIERLGIRDFNDFANLIPGLNLVDQGPGETKLTIRGLNAQVGEALTAVYYDEIPVNGGPGTEGDSGAREPGIQIVDVERIEVLRGPQGTLYGQGSMGGTVRIIFNKPNLTEYEGRIQGGLSSTRHGGLNYNSAAIANLPLIDDLLAARFTGFYSKNGGYIDNTVLGLKDINDSETYGGRAMIKLQPTDSFSLLGTVMLQHFEAGSRNYYLPSTGSLNQGVRTRTPFLDKNELYNLTANYDLGWANFVATGSYFHRDLTVSFDGDVIDAFATGPLAPVSCAARFGGACTPDQLQENADILSVYIPAIVRQPQTQKIWSYESRLTSAGDTSVGWTIGLFYQKRDFDLSSQIIAGTDQGFPQSPELFALDVDSFFNSRQWAVFGEAEWAVTDALKLTAGARWFDFRSKSGGFTHVGFAPFNSPSGPLPAGSAQEDKVIFKFHVGYEPAENILFYAQASQGFRAGGINRQVVPSIPPSYGSDSVWNYELGAKTSWWNNQLIFNAAFYRIDWSDIQSQGASVGSPFSFTSNAGSAAIDGIELELTARPAAGLELAGSLGWKHARLTEDVNPGQPRAGLKGDDIPHVPELGANVSAEYTADLAPDLSGFARVDVSYQGSVTTAFNEASGPLFARTDEYVRTDLRVGVDSSRGWGATVFINNLTDSDAIVFRLPDSFGLVEGRAVALQPRTFGLSFYKNF